MPLQITTGPPHPGARGLCLFGSGTVPKPPRDRTGSVEPSLDFKLQVVIRTSRQEGKYPWVRWRGFRASPIDDRVRTKPSEVASLRTALPGAASPSVEPPMLRSGVLHLMSLKVMMEHLKAKANVMDKHKAQVDERITPLRYRAAALTREGHRTPAMAAGLSRLRGPARAGRAPQCGPGCWQWRAGGACPSCRRSKLYQRRSQTAS